MFYFLLTGFSLLFKKKLATFYIFIKNSVFFEEFNENAVVSFDVYQLKHFEFNDLIKNKENCNVN